MREHRLCYRSPAPNIESGVAVCVGFMSAGYTPKHGLTGAIFLVDMPAHKALTAGVSWVNNKNRDACFARFIFNKAAKLGESPVVQAFPLLFVGLSPGADILEVFKTNRALGAFSFGNDATRDVVVNPLLETALSSAHFPKPTLRGFGSFLLQHGAAFNVPLALCFYVFAAELFSPGIGSDVNDSKINAKNAFWFQQIGVVKVTNRSDIPLAANKHQIHFTLAMLEQLALMFTTNKPDLNSSGQRPNRHSIIGQKPKNPVVIGLCARGAKRALGLFIQLVGIGHFGNTAHRHLRRQSKLFSNRSVNQLMQIVLPKSLIFPGLKGNPMTRGIAPFKRLLKKLRLFRCRLQFEVGDQFHNFKYRRLCADGQQKRPDRLAVAAIPPRPESRGLSRKI
jgi:hypothetical protein